MICTTTIEVCILLISINSLIQCLEKNDATHANSYRYRAQKETPLSPIKIKNCAHAHARAGNEGRGRWVDANGMLRARGCAPKIKRRNFAANNVGAKQGISSSMSVGYPPSTRPKVLSPGYVHFFALSVRNQACWLKRNCLIHSLSYIRDGL